MKKTFRSLHLWLSLPFGLLITVICFSGAVLVFEKELTEWYRPGFYNTEKVEPASPSAKVETASPPAGKLKKKHHRERLPFFRTMFRLHRWLLDAKNPDGGIFWGKLVVGTSTLMFVFVLVSGIFIWLPRTWRGLKNGLKIPVRKGWRRFCYGLHVAGGMYALIFLLIMALTGLTWSFSWYRTGFYEACTWLCQAFGAEATEATGKMRMWIYSVHVGSWGGLTTRILTFVAALIGATLPLTGYYLWARRLLGKSRRKCKEKELASL